MKLARWVVVLLVSTLLPLLPRAPAQAIAGDLDLSFGGGDGKVTTPVTGFDAVNDVAIQTDGKIVAAGYAGTSGAADFAIARYGLDGALDTTFGGGTGIVTTPIAGDDQVQALAIQGDGRIVVAGQTKSTNYDVALVRYNSDGTPDSSFGGGDGITVTPIFGGDDIGNDVAIQSDGKIVVAGSTASGVSVDFATLRYESTGSLDPSFGGGDGIATIDFGGKEDRGYAVQLQADGKIVVGGLATVSTEANFGIARYSIDGSPDSTFDGDGKAWASMPVVSQDRIFDMALQADGKIVGAGYVKSSVSKEDFALVRFTGSGGLDTTFDGDGFATTDLMLRNQRAYAVSIQSDGKIVATGFTEQPAAFDFDFMVARYNPDGSLDTSFSLDGFVTTTIGLIDDGYAAAIQADGKIVAAGDSQYDFALVRYLSATETGSGVPSDFNGDGYGDLAVGAPYEDIGTASDTGGVNVLYGSAAGLSSTGNQFIDETSTGLLTDATGDVFGWSTAVGDFNGDQFADLAVGAPGNDQGAWPDAGGMFIILGSGAGLVPTAGQYWSQASPDIQSDPQADEVFGLALAAGDLNGDGFGDVSVGVPGEAVGGDSTAGAVNVLYGGASGLTSVGNQFWSQDSTDINNAAEPDDEFGLSVAIGDFDGNGFGDLAVGVPLETLTNGTDAGAVNVIYGSAAGLTATNDDFWNQDSTDINDKVEKDDWFGYSLAVGDFDADTFVDLLVGVPAEGINNQSDAGAANLIFGTSSGLAATGDQFWHQDKDGINDTAEPADTFAFSISAGDFDGDGFDDAAFGIPGEDVTGATDGGAVSVIYGTSAGLDDPGDQFWKQNSTDIEDSSETGDVFGVAVVAADFGNGPEADLAIGVQWEDIGSILDAGGVNVIYGSPSAGLAAPGDQFWSQDSASILDQSEAGDLFGFGLAEPGSKKVGP